MCTASKYVHGLIPETSEYLTFHVKRDSTDGIKKGRLFRLAGSNQITKPLKKENFLCLEAKDMNQMTI